MAEKNRYEPRSTDYEPLLAELVDRDMYNSEALYHAQVETFRRWLTMTDRAMRDEELVADVRRNVLRRLVYGVPNAADAYLRRDRERQMVRNNAIF